MNKLLRSFLLSVMLVGSAQAQAPATSKLSTSNHQLSVGERATRHVERPMFAPPASPLAIDVPGANQLPLRNFFPAHTNGRAMHNIQVDPSNPNLVHAVLMADFAPNVTEGPETDRDTSSGANASYFPGRRDYYLFSSDAGVTWSAPKSLSTTRAGYPDLMLYKNGSTYLPLISHHRLDAGTDDYRSVLLIGTGTPGSGDFTEVVTNREHATEGAGDLLWPAIALSPAQDKIYMISSLSPGSGNDPVQFQFSTFDFNPTAGTATWNGPWKNGPGNEETAMETGGMTVIRTSQNGKVGIMWVSDAENAENLYFSESTDGGNTWSESATPVYELVGAFGVDQQGQLTPTNPESKMTPASGLDFFYNGETANAIWTASARTPVTNNSYTYYPSISAIMYWKQGSVPASLLSRTEWSEDYEHINTQGGLSFFPVGNETESQGGNLENSIIARTADPRIWSVIYSAWMEGDTSESFTYERGAEVEESYTYRSVWQITTTNGGATWSEPAMIQGSDPEDTETQPTLDFRFPQVSTWNPMLDPTHVGYQLLYAADTLGGVWFAGGTPIWGDMTYFSQRLSVEIPQVSVKRTGTTENLSLGQNYPNPFTPSTSVTFSVKQAAQVRLVVEDMMGREVAVAFEGMALPGRDNKVMIDASKLTSGVYQYVLKTENESVARRMVLSK